MQTPVLKDRARWFCSILGKANAQPRLSIDESRSGSRRQSEDAMGFGRRSRASRDVTGPADGIRPPGLSDDLWQRFLQVTGLVTNLCMSQC